MDMWGPVWAKEGGKYPKQVKQHQMMEDMYKSLGDDFDVSTTYSKAQIKDIDDFLARLPEDLDPELALRRVFNDPDVAYADFDPRMGSKVTSDPEDISNLRKWSERHRADMSMTDEASEALYLVDEKDLDMWYATGKTPDSYPDELIPYLDEGIFQEGSGKISGWGNEQGLDYGPEDMLSRYMATKMEGMK